MILLGSKLFKTPVMSLQTGGEVGKTVEAIIDPASLAIVGYTVQGQLISQDTGTVLRIADVRELSDLGFIVDSIDELVNPAEIIKLQEIYNLGFGLVGISVLDERRKKIGKVTDYTVETGNFVIQQLTVHRPLLQSFNDTELVIHRSQIIEVSKNAIVVHSEAKIPEPTRAEVSGSYVNPFRKSTPASESIKTRQ